MANKGKTAVVLGALGLGGLAVFLATRGVLYGKPSGNCGLGVINPVASPSSVVPQL